MRLYSALYGLGVVILNDSVPFRLGRLTELSDHLTYQLTQAHSRAVNLQNAYL